MSLSMNHVHDICRVGESSKTCRYLATKLVGGQVKHICAKKSPQRKIIDMSIASNKNKDPDAPMGDNCKGFLPFEHLVQGYDI